jgi:hypothetical protein
MTTRSDGRGTTAPTLHDPSLMRRGSALAAVLAVVLMAFGCGSPPHSDPGPKGLERHVLSYMDALRSGDAKQVAGLLNQPADSADVREQIATYGHRDFKNVHIVSSSEFPHIYRVAMSAATGLDSWPVAANLTAKWDLGEGQWHISPFFPPPTAASTPPR